MAQARRINELTGLNIAPTHTLKDQAALQRAHLWMCDGPCRNDPGQNYGIYQCKSKRPPGPHNLFWARHGAACQGEFQKVGKPVEQYVNKYSKRRTREEAEIADHQDRQRKKR